MRKSVLTRAANSDPTPTARLHLHERDRALTSFMASYGVFMMPLFGAQPTDAVRAINTLAWRARALVAALPPDVLHVLREAAAHPDDLTLRRMATIGPDQFQAALTTMLQQMEGETTEMGLGPGRPGLAYAEVSRRTNATVQPPRWTRSRQQGDGSTRGAEDCCHDQPPMRHPVYHRFPRDKRTHQTRLRRYRQTRHTSAVAGMNCQRPTAPAGDFARASKPQTPTVRCT